MKKAFYILIMRQIGNVGAHEITKIEAQPKEGFVSEKAAEKHLKKLFDLGDYPFNKRNWECFVINKVYSSEWF